MAYWVSHWPQHEGMVTTILKRSMCCSDSSAVWVQRATKSLQTNMFMPTVHWRAETRTVSIDEFRRRENFVKQNRLGQFRLGQHAGTVYGTATPLKLGYLGRCLPGRKRPFGPHVNASKHESCR